MAVEADAAPFHVESDAIAEGFRVRFVGEFDIAAMPIAEVALDEALEHDDRRLVLDLGGLSFIDSSGLRFLVAAVERCQGVERSVVIRRGCSGVQRVFEMTRLDRMLPFEE